VIRIALILVVVLACLDLAGARADVGILSGTAPGSELELVSGLAYALAWFGAVLVAPILVLSSVIARLLRRLAGRCGRMSPVATWTDSRLP
jgi:hypothetical protein